MAAPPQPKEVNRDTDIISFELGNGIGFLGLMPVPIPWTDLELGCSIAFWWAEAAEVLRPCHAHIVVGLKDDRASPVARAQSLTRLVDSVTQGSAGAGVVWGSGGVVMQPKCFVKQLARWMRPHIPSLSG